MFEDSELKLELSLQRIDELAGFIKEKQPFTYVLETNTKTLQRSTFARQDKHIIKRIATLSGEAINSIRAALDNAYWVIVSPYASNRHEQRKIQFPFCEKEEHLDGAIRGKLGDRVGEKFYDTLVALAPHGEVGGNRHLYLIDRLGIGNRHRQNVLMGDYRELSSERLRKQISDFPKNLIDIGISNTGRDVCWNSHWQHWLDIGVAVNAEKSIFEKVIDLPVYVMFDEKELGFCGEVVETLGRFHRSVEDAITAMRESC